MENEKKFCPINPSTDEILPCCQEKCALWDWESHACAMLVIAKSLKRRK